MSIKKERCDDCGQPCEGIPTWADNGTKRGLWFCSDCTNRVLVQCGEKATNKTQNMKNPMTSQRWREAKHQAHTFAAYLIGEGGYTSRSCNRVAFEMLIAGWMAAQPWYVGWARELARRFPNDDPFLHLQDWAMELASDLAFKLAI